MKKIVLAAMAASTALIATPAAAQTVTGTVDVTGTVTEKCSVVAAPSTSGGSSTFAGTIALGALDDGDGTLKDTLIATTNASTAGIHITTRVVCNTAAPKVTIAATPLQNLTADLADTGGYSDTIHYTAQVEVDMTTGSEFRRVSTTGSIVSPGAGPTALALPINAGAGDNVDVSVYELSTNGGNTSILRAGSYKGVVTVTISPT